MQTLTVYYSRAGGNYMAGGIQNIEVGNTQVVAQFIKEIVGGDECHVRPVKEYSVEYTPATEEAKKDLHDNIRPEIIANVTSIDPYKVVFVGFPIWWGTFPRGLATFLEKFNWAGKKIAPFCTHEGSNFGESLSELKKLCPNATILKSLAIYGHDAQNSKDKVQKWIKSLGL